VIDHDSGRLVWAAPGRDRKTVEAFFDQLGQNRCKELELVSADMAAWIAGPVRERCPNAVLCIDPFHVIGLATGALDAVRRQVWNDARRAGQTGQARELKGARFAVWKNPEHLTARQQAKLSMIQATNQRLYRAYLLKEQLRQIYQLPAQAALSHPRRSRKHHDPAHHPPRVRLPHPTTAHRARHAHPLKAAPNATRTRHLTHENDTSAEIYR
jgi:transposase